MGTVTTAADVTAGGTTTGVVGQSWRGEITPWGDVVPADGSTPVRWFVAADDRWHRPADERTLRQHRPSGAPVTETRLRVPGGDVVQRVWSVADHGGLTILSFENASSMPVAVALTRRDLATSRPPAAVPVEGIDLPDETIVLPVGHRTSATVALAHGRASAGPLPEFSTFESVVRGWISRTERASRVVIDDDDHGEQLNAARSDLVLEGLDDPDEAPGSWLVGVGELVRLGEVAPAAIDLELVAEAVERIAPTDTWSAGAGLAAAAHLLEITGERRAARDLERIRSRRPAPGRQGGEHARVLVIPAVEQRFARDGALLPGGFDPAWLGRSIEAYTVPTGPRSSVSYAVRWHGARPALLWEQHGEPVTLTCPAVDLDWATSDVRGETLLAAPPAGSQATR